MHTFLALCAVGAETILSNELKLSGFKPAAKLPGRVFFTAGAGEAEPLMLSMFRANFYLRTADRIYLVLKTFSAENFDDLFEAVFSIDWQDWFFKDSKITIDKARIYKSTLNSEHAVQSVAHKAICEKLCKVWKMRLLPESGTAFALRIYIEKDRAHVCLDLSGEPLHRRGYRLSGGAAPMRETLAATLLHCLMWKRKFPLHDAFCGSGTIPIEATWFAHNIPPGINRSFAFENFACFDKAKSGALIAQEKEKAIRSIKTDCLVRITGSDKDASMVSLAQKNAERACMIAGRALQSVGDDSKIPRPEFVQADFSDLAAPYPEGILLSNPPYGERLDNKEESLLLYQAMTKLPEAFAGWKLGFITDKPEFESIFAKAGFPLKKKELKGGNLNTCLYIYG
ncbi:THUMP domain-containing class I SAM-dependent RNA methyltransferase [Treponema phagedenis]|uniref:THUMP domain-containing class I SAM-dependent RNA methyltransferase n=1 Tax=Treponema phagedenis TaxID=162 RepID=UPI0011E6165B|nr:class I SAM-dependent RNA methyltransferase [Treponema phagedenis]QEK07361.1 class I SAM-dependent RNA methyltransferase [Treponema phagedenis]